MYSNLIHKVIYVLIRRFYVTKTIICQATRLLAVPVNFAKMYFFLLSKYIVKGYRTSSTILFDAFIPTNL